MFASRRHGDKSRTGFKSPVELLKPKGTRGLDLKILQAVSGYNNGIGCAKSSRRVGSSALTSAVPFRLTTARVVDLYTQVEGLFVRY